MDSNSPQQITKVFDVLSSPKFNAIRLMLKLSDSELASESWGDAWGERYSEAAVSQSVVRVHEAQRNPLLLRLASEKRT